MTTGGPLRIDVRPDLEDVVAFGIDTDDLCACDFDKFGATVDIGVNGFPR